MINPLPAPLIIVFLPIVGGFLAGSGRLTTMTQSSFDFDKAARVTYPYTPGHRDTDTSQEAASVIEPRAATLRAHALALLQREALTADEAAERLGESILAIRPRCTELNKQGLIEDTGERRLNASGRRAIVWRAK